MNTKLNIEEIKPQYRSESSTIPKKQFIYQIKNNINGKSYIGCTINPERRWKEHQSCALGVDNKKYPINHALNKYGFENFTFGVIAEAENAKEGYDKETQLIDEHKSLIDQNGYNLRGGGEGIKDFTEETIKRMSDAAKNRAPRTFSEQAKINMSLARIGMKMKKWSPEAKAHQSESKKKHLAEREDLRMGLANKTRGTTWSVERRNNTMAARKKFYETNPNFASERGKRNIIHLQTKEAQTKSSMSRKGKKFSEQHKENIRIAAKNRAPRSMETRLKMKNIMIELRANKFWSTTRKS